MSRMPIPHRIAPLAAKPCSSAASCRISPDFSGLSVCAGQVAYALLTRAPVAGGRGRTLSPAAPRLACVKPVASVHPEPGSNSPLFVSLNLFFSSVARSSLHADALAGLSLFSDLTKRRVMLMTLLLYYLSLILQMFQSSLFLSPPCGWRKNDAKLMLIFQTTKLFWGNFCFFFFFNRCPKASFSKASAKVGTFYIPSKFSRIFFQRIFEPNQQHSDKQQNKNARNFASQQIPRIISVGTN